MKRLGGVWDELTSFANLHRAWCKAQRGKRHRPEVVAFALGLGSQLLLLQNELCSGSYRPGSYRLFQIYERKPRLIAAAPFRDRVAHHAILNVIEPSLDRLDHEITQKLGCRAYLRYVDDLILLGHSKAECSVWCEVIAARMREQRLLLHPRKAHLYHTSRGIDCLGYQVFPYRRRI